ncbi:MAG: RNA polymerase sigma factor [Saprospiraceae bacterium]
MEERHIITGCKKGQEQAFKSLVETYSPMLMSVCLRYIKDRERAKDILQESLIKICKNIGQYEEKGSFKNWILTILINTSLKEIKKYKHLEDLDSLKNETYTESSPIELLHIKDIKKIIHQMPEMHRIVFNMHVVDGYSHAEIATTLDIAESSSRVYLTRARQFLRLEVNERELKNKIS